MRSVVPVYVNATMRSFLMVLVCTGAILLPGGCVDPLELSLKSRLDVVVVDGTITNLAEPVIIRLYRSVGDPVTGRSGSLPLTKATVEVVLDSSEVIMAYETTDGYYQLPADFRGRVGHAYQLRFTLSDGARYQSDQQIMPSAPPISRVSARFNPASLPAVEVNGQRYTAGHDLYIDTQDPASQANYYRWDWRLWEKLSWCRTCIQGQYSINNVLVQRSGNGSESYRTGNSLFENCFNAPPRPNFQPAWPYWAYDYFCRTECWGVFSSSQLVIFADTYTNGGQITGQKVAQIRYYQTSPCLVEVRQSALSPRAYRFYKQLQDQTENTGGVADTPPTASIGNVQNVANPREAVIGIFTASSVATARYFLDRRDTQGAPPGLFEALNGRDPNPEPVPPQGNPNISIINDIPGQRAPFTAVCSPSQGQTPVKPEGWRD